MQFDSLESMLLTTAEGVRPPERLLVSEASTKYRKINNPGSYVGNWDNDFAGYLVEPMDVLTSEEYKGMIFVGPARAGKSELFFNWLAHTQICDPADMMAVHMTQASARDWSVGDLRKAFRNSPDLGKRVLAGRQNMNVHDVRFTSGTRLLTKWPTISELSGKTSPRNWLFDYDRMPDDIDKEGAPYWLTAKRAETFGFYGMTVAESSPGREVPADLKWKPAHAHEAPPAKGILELYNIGDRRRFYWRCINPKCSHSFEPDFRLLDYPASADFKESAEAVRMLCPVCKTPIDHDMKRQMNQHQNGTSRWLRQGEIWLPNDRLEGMPRRSDIASFWLKGAAAAFASWHDLVLKYLNAMRGYETTGSTEALKNTINLDQGNPFSPTGLHDERLAENIKGLAKDYGNLVVPPGVRFLTANIDVQRNRFIVQVHGFYRGERNGFGDVIVIDRFAIRKSNRLDEDGERFPITPRAFLEDWKLLIEQVILKTYALGDNSGRHMAIKAVTIDGYGEPGVTPNAYNFWRYLRDGPEDGVVDGTGWIPNLHRRVIISKGDPIQKSPRVRIGYPDSDRKDRMAGARGEIPVMMIASNELKDLVSNMLERSDPTNGGDKPGGRVCFPDWLPSWFYDELVAESRDAAGKWVNPRNIRNESWDLLCYALAVCLTRLIGIENLRWDEPPGWADEWDMNDLVFAPATGERPFVSRLKEEKQSLSDLANDLA